MKKPLLTYLNYSNPWSCIVFGTKDFDYDENYELFNFPKSQKFRSFDPYWTPSRRGAFIETICDVNHYISFKNEDSNLYILPSFQNLTYFSLPIEDNKIYVSGGYSEYPISVNSEEIGNFLYLCYNSIITLIELRDRLSHSLIKPKKSITISDVSLYSNVDFFINAASDNCFNPRFLLGPILNISGEQCIDVLDVSAPSMSLIGMSGCGELILSPDALNIFIKMYPQISFDKLKINRKSGTENERIGEFLYKLNIPEEDVIDLESSKSQLLGLTYEGANIIQFEQISLKENLTKTFPIIKIMHSNGVFLFKKEFLERLLNSKDALEPSFELIPIPFSHDEPIPNI